MPVAQTVVMLQVQNEVGLLGDSRDRSTWVEKIFNEPVPAQLINHLVKNKERICCPLRQLMGDQRISHKWFMAGYFGNTTAAEEAFMAWHYAKFINTVVKAGKAEYPLPMFVNAWIVQPEDKGPGDYPSGGPQSHVHDIWRAGAPSLDILAPDIYLPNFDEITAMYTRSGNILFIPESRADDKGAANAFMPLASIMRHWLFAIWY